MKYILIRLAFWVLILSVASCGNGGNNNGKSGNPDGNTNSGDSLNNVGNPGDSSLITVINRMIDLMDDMSLTEHFDVHYAKLMMLHHQGAIDMARIEIAKGKDEKLIALAREIMDRKAEEIKILETNVSYHKPKAADDVTDRELKESINKMMRGMKTIEIKGNTDHEYAQMMVLHLQCAIEMSAQEVIQGHHVQLKLKARDMIRDDNTTLDQIKAWLSDN